MTTAQIKASLRAQAERWGIGHEEKEALLAAADRLPEWKPIEGAPKDERAVDVWSSQRGKRTPDVRWAYGCWNEYSVDDYGEPVRTRMQHQPTHYMEIPEGPCET